MSLKKLNRFQILTCMGAQQNSVNGCVRSAKMGETGTFPEVQPSNQTEVQSGGRKLLKEVKTRKRSHSTMLSMKVMERTLVYITLSSMASIAQVVKALFHMLILLLWSDSNVSFLGCVCLCSCATMHYCSWFLLVRFIILIRNNSMAAVG